MKRLMSQRVVGEVAAALELYPVGLRRLLGFDVFEGDPIFAGIARYTTTRIGDGRSYHETAHVCYPWHARDRRTTVVLPSPIGVPHTVHELGHVLDCVLGFEVSTEPVTYYAQTDRGEAFAEFVTALLVPGYLWWDPRADSARSQVEPFAQLQKAGLEALA